jgi:ABC-2 type transport system ATP-binding protein
VAGTLISYPQHRGRENEVALVNVNKITAFLEGIVDCKINFDSGTNIIIHSEQAELVLLQVLRILNDNKIEIEDLSAVPTNLEEIFLKMVSDNASNN